MIVHQKKALAAGGADLSHFESSRLAIIRKKRLTTILGAVLMVAIYIVTARIGNVSIQNLRDIDHVFDYVKDMVPTLRPAYLGYDLNIWFRRGPIWISRMFDTILIAFIATTISSITAFILAFAASRNLVKNRFLTFITRRVLEIARGVPELVYAMIFVFAFKLGALPGILAIAVHSIGSLGKLFSEVNENVSMRSLEGVRSVGGNWFQVMRYAVVPQVLPNYVSYSLLRLELNVRAATVVGLVGAGGIGMELMTAIRQFQYTDISAITLMVIAVVFVMDWASEKIRYRLIGEENLK